MQEGCSTVVAKTYDSDIRCTSLSISKCPAPGEAWRGGGAASSSSSASAGTYCKNGSESSEPWKTLLIAAVCVCLLLSSREA
jgi:hypothetical protein